ncbi:sensor histidine kinase [Microbacterium sp. TNHR37B]|uniref:sensor histidine kinase n=1 Tax=Microbacterium sp. TNHR37B TaxID=1775956 RepID=UPI0007B2363C|nr:histidine kinase [Microbacterium sp. TNHR37B]KZE90554.1 Sensor histidine kinase LiaS [Microbacterium sp. TNHR37B]
MTHARAVLDDPILRGPALARWFHERPRIADALVILACTAPTLAALLLTSPAHAWLGYLCACAVATAFWWRRTAPFAVLLIVVALATLNPVSAHGMTPALLESFFALFTLAAHARLRTVVVGLVLSHAVVVLTTGLAVALGMREDWPALFLSPTSLAACALGVAVRAGRARRAAIEEVVQLREERAAAAERARITAEMHDVVAHSVTVMVALAGGAAAAWEKHPERARSALDQLGTVGARALEEMQRILRVLRQHDAGLDRDLESSGYNLPSLEELVDVFGAAGLPVALVTDDEDVRENVLSDPALRTTVYRVVQESLTNALRHAHDATYVEVRLSTDGGQVIVSVTDNGNGALTPRSVGAGVGLRAMRERAAAFGGDFAAGPIPRREDAPGNGWRTRVSIPLRQDAA